jgi:hypothetical protein
MDNLDALSRAGYLPTDGMITTVHDAEISIQHACQQLGYYYAVESSGIFGIRWGGANFHAVYQHEFLFSNMTRPFPIEFMAKMGLDWHDVLFRCLANRICYGMTYDPNKGETGALFFDSQSEYPLDAYPDAVEVFGKMNRIFRQVEADMQLLQLLPDEKGTIWNNHARNINVVWAYHPVEIPLRENDTVESITGSVNIENGVLHCDANGVYRIRKG